jgi:hypothetical protein
MKHKCSQYRQGNVVKRGFVAHCCHLQNNKLDDTKSNNSVKNIIFFFFWYFFFVFPIYPIISFAGHGAQDITLRITVYCFFFVAYQITCNSKKCFHNSSRYSQILNCLRTGLSAVYQHFNVSSELIVLQQMPLNLQLLNS